MFEPLPSELVHALAGSTRRLPFGAPIHYYPETRSTNDVAASLAERGAPEGATVIASAQTAGRGRMGRGWYSPPDAGLYVSVICRNAAAAPFLTLAGGVAAADGIRSATGLPVEIKWPNDVVIAVTAGRTRRRKVAGVLAEAASDGARLRYVVLGFGINVRPSAYPADVADRATSLESELGRAVDAAHVLVGVLDALGTHYRALADGRRADLLARWRELAPSCSGARVECETGRGRAPGITAGLADDGALLVRIGDRVERILSGEVVWKV
jgi:BirA family biotin operon repressor/biotin-[acetyl-CoA-carboxylase] ligase